MLYKPNEEHPVSLVSKKNLHFLMFLCVGSKKKTGKTFQITFLQYISKNLQKCVPCRLPLVGCALLGAGRPPGCALPPQGALKEGEMKATYVYQIATK
jgi:hypothetical protein